MLFIIVGKIIFVFFSHFPTPISTKARQGEMVKELNAILAPQAPIF